jgi:hypothetical protein
MTTSGSSRRALAYPSAEAAVTGEWLTEALSCRFPGVRVQTARILERIEGTATKLRFGLVYASETDQAGAPASLWVKAGFGSRGAQQGEAFANEVRFFGELAPLLPINKPDSFYGAIDPLTGDGLVLLEDLLARSVVFAQSLPTLTPQQAAAVLSLQARYHAFFWKSARLAEFRWLKPGGTLADTDMVQQYFQLWERATALPRFRAVPPAQQNEARACMALQRLMRCLARDSFCLVHGDAHAANLFFEPDGTPGYLDWQHCMRGHWAFDVANLMITSLSVADRRARERELLTHYLGELQANGVPPPAFNEAWGEYCRYAVWPFMWVMCPPDVHPEALCILNTSRACAAIDDLQSIERLEAL